MSNLNICFLAGTLGCGGAERQLSYMLRALRHSEVKTRVLCLTRGEFYEKEIESLGARPECVGWSEKGARLTRPQRLRRVVQSLRREPADIIQSAHFYTNLYGALAARWVKAKDIGAIRSDLSSEMHENGLLAWGDLRLPHHLITNSALARERAIALGVKPERIDFVPNAVETNDDDSFPLPDRPLNLLFVGRLTEEKRPDLFVRVAANVMRQTAPQAVSATLAGDGPLRDSLQALAKQLDFKTGQLEFAGQHREMENLYRRADVVLLTSDWEGTPNVLLEAMSYGVVVVATRVGGVPDIVGQDRGLLVDANDEDALTQATLRLLADAKLRHEFGSAGRQYVAQNHSLHSLQWRLTTIYRKILAA